MKSLDEKLQRLRRDPAANAFILADARDADMAWGISSFGKPWPPDPANPDRFRSQPEFCEEIRRVVQQGAVDILLGSVSVMDQLARVEGIFAGSSVTPAIRANDTTDVWVGRGARYRQHPSRAFSTCHIREVQSGRLQGPTNQSPVINLGLYSITFTNDLETDLANLEEFRRFRAEAEERGFRYFLEVFDPNIEAGLTGDEIPAFVNDSIVRTLAGIPASGRPDFLKIVYHGPRWIEELVHYDPSLIVGVLGGSAGTTRDAFQLLADARRAGARVALYGRKIKDAENPLEFIRHLRAIADGEIQPEEAVRSYHGALERKKCPPKRTLEDDLKITDTTMHY